MCPKSTTPTGQPGIAALQAMAHDDSALRALTDFLQPSEQGAGIFRFAVRSVGSDRSDFHTVTGAVLGGGVARGDDVMVAATLKRSNVRQIISAHGDTENAVREDVVTLVLADDCGVQAGDVLHRPGEPPQRSDQFQAHLVWHDAEPMLPERSYMLSMGEYSTPVQITDLKYVINTDNREHLPATKLEQNELAVCNFATARAIAFDGYDQCVGNSTFQLIDRISREPVAVGMIDFGLHRGQNLSWQSFEINRDLRSQMKNQKPLILWFTGLSASGKSTIADIVEQKLAAQDRHTYLLDGDNFRHGLNKDLGFTDADRVENIRRVAEVARLMADSGLIVMTAFISPFRRERRMAREIAGDIEFKEIFVDTPLAVCEARDPKGMYARARKGEIPNFTGISSDYEPPELADVHLLAGERSAEQLADEVLRAITHVLQ